MNYDPKYKIGLESALMEILDLDEYNLITIDKNKKAIKSCLKNLFNENKAAEYINTLYNIKFDSINENEPIGNIVGVFERGKKKLTELVDEAKRDLV